MACANSKVKEFQINTPYGCIAAKYWNETSEKTPILALHGWMDNAGTWDSLCPLLNAHPIVAIDSPGHGLSSYPIGLGSYITDNLVTIERVIQHLQWPKVILLGHSMGGGSAMLYAGTMPEKIEKLIMIDLLKPMEVAAEDQPERTRRSLQTLLEAEKRTLSESPSYEYSQILEKLIKSYGQSLTEESANTLLIRGSKKHENGLYSFTHSPILKAKNTLSMTVEQQLSFAKKVTCPLLLMKAVSSPLYVTREITKLFLETYKKNSTNFVLEVVEGTHHLHLNDPKTVSKIVNDFLDDLPQKEVNKRKSNEFIASML